MGLLFAVGVDEPGGAGERHSPAQSDGPNTYTSKERRDGIDSQGTDD